MYILIYIYINDANVYIFPNVEIQVEQLKIQIMSSQTCVFFKKK